MRHKIILEILTALLILLWVYAAVSKLLDYDQFKWQLGNSPLIPLFVTVLAWLLPTIEIVTAGMLTVKSTRFYGFAASLFLLAVFTGYIAGMLLFDSHLPCSCGGIISGFTWKEHLIFNLFFIVLSTVSIVLEKNEKRAYNQKQKIETIH